MLAAQPKSADAITLKGEILALRGDADGAIQRFDEALTLDPGNTGARLARANVYLNRNDFTALDKDLEVLLKAAPQDVRANYLRALEYVKKQDFAAADKILDRLSPSFANLPEGILCPGSDQIPAEAIWPSRRRDCEIRGAGTEQPGRRAARGADRDGRGNRNAAVDYLTCVSAQIAARCDDAGPARQDLRRNGQAGSGSRAVREGSGARP